jgi:hypothetical protein
MKARIYLRRAALDGREYLGEQDVEPAPVLNGVVHARFDGRSQPLRIDRLDPPNWTPESEAIPLIHVVPALVVPSRVENRYDRWRRTDAWSGIRAD